MQSVQPLRRYPLRLTPRSQTGLRDAGESLDAAALPARADNRAHFSHPPYDQGELGSCTANALAAALEPLCRPTFRASRLFLYTNELLRDSEPPALDAGSTLETGLAVLGETGVCPEELWGYDPSHFGLKPPETCYTAAQHCRLARSTPVPVSQFRAVLASGKVIVLGILVFPSLESPEVRTSGQVPLPDRTREQQLGGHAICLCGYDDAAKRYLLRNSWGASWGQGGYCWVPYAYLHDPELASDGYALLSLASAP